MKRALVASILGIAASVASSYGQANIVFDTYLAVPGSFVRWTTDAAFAPAGRAGTAATAGEFVANLLWQYGATTGSAGLAVPTSGPVGSYGPGYIRGPNVATAGNYTAVADITFTIQAWQGASDYASALNKGSLTWTEPSTSANPFVPGGPLTTFSYMPGNIIVSLPIPEPSTLAFAGLGAAPMLIFRRRQ